MTITVLDRTYGYLIVLEEDEGGWFVAHVPELPGCISEGCGFEDAVQHITGSIEDYLSLLDEDSSGARSSVTGSEEDLEETSTGAPSAWVAAL